MTDADLRALCARVAREALPKVAQRPPDFALLVLDRGQTWHFCFSFCEGGLSRVPLSVPYADADALAAALYDAAKAQGAAEGGP